MQQSSKTAAAVNGAAIIKARSQRAYPPFTAQSSHGVVRHSKIWLPMSGTGHERPIPHVRCMSYPPQIASRMAIKKNFALGKESPARSAMRSISTNMLLR
jgi:hypothetical protein